MTYIQKAVVALHNIDETAAEMDGRGGPSPGAQWLLVARIGIAIVWALLAIAVELSELPKER